MRALMMLVALWASPVAGEEAPAPSCPLVDQADDAVEPALRWCNEDEDCGVGWHCSSRGICLPDPPECRRNSDCGADAICQNGRCFEV